jgi:uncharacterized protein
MQIENLNWDDYNIEHIARHQVTPREVEEVCFSTSIYTRDSPDRYIVSGQSGSGRYLNVVIEKIGKGLYRPVTAFEMSDKYRQVYKRATGR